jgi:hypothetical protein
LSRRISFDEPRISSAASRTFSDCSRDWPVQVAGELLRLLAQFLLFARQPLQLSAALVLGQPLGGELPLRTGEFVLPPRQLANPLLQIAFTILVPLAG